MGHRGRGLPVSMSTVCSHRPSLPAPTKHSSHRERALLPPPVVWVPEQSPYAEQWLQPPVRSYRCPIATCIAKSKRCDPARYLFGKIELLWHGEQLEATWALHLQAPGRAAPFSSAGIGVQETFLPFGTCQQKSLSAWWLGT